MYCCSLNKNQNRQRGFSLIEAIVTMSIFTLIVVSALGSLLAIINANRKAQALKLAINNLNFSIEKMSRDTRAGSEYHCDTSLLPLGDPSDCEGGSSSFAFADKKCKRVIYRLNPATNVFEVSYDRGAFQPFASNLITFDSVRFTVIGSDSRTSDGTQASVLISLKGYAGGNDPRVRSDFNIQTMVAQRNLDVPQASC